MDNSNLHNIKDNIITSIVAMLLDFDVYGHDRTPTPVIFSHHCCHYNILHCNRIVKRCLYVHLYYIRICITCVRHNEKNEAELYENLISIVMVILRAVHKYI